MSVFLCLLLSLYPRQFRNEYGEEWLEVARLRSARALLVDSVLALPPLWMRHLGLWNDTNHLKAPLMDTLLQDLRFGIRSLSRRPLFAAVAIATLGLGIGSATTMFSVVNTVLIDSVPFARAGRLVNVWQISQGARNAPGLVGRG